jgi:tight adherence protein B
VLRTRLEATGRPITLGNYGVACLAIAVAVLVIAKVFGAPFLLALLEAVATGLWLPHMAIGFLVNRRKARFFKHFPETVALMVRGLRAGLPVTETISVVAREVPDPVGEEFRGVADQVRLGAPLEEAMWRTARRLDLAEFNFLVTSLSVQRETGGNLAETLENLEHIVRRRQQMRLKIKAMSAEATASALIIGSLPFVMTLLMWVVSRSYIIMLFTAPFGRVMIMFGLASLFVGAMVMHRMVKFEV